MPRLAELLVHGLLLAASSWDATAVTVTQERESVLMRREEPPVLSNNTLSPGDVGDSEDLLDTDTISLLTAARRSLNQHKALREAELHRIVYQSLQPLGGIPQSYSAVGRPKVQPPTLSKICMPSDSQVDTSAFLRSPSYKQQVHDGMGFVKDKRLIIAGMWRQIGSGAVSHVYNALKALGEYFDDHQLIMLENDSKDDTVAGIRDVCTADVRAWCFTLTGLGKEVLHNGAKDRIRGLTALRHSLLQKVFDFDKGGVFDYVMMVDADIFAQGNGGFDIGGALASFALTRPGSATHADVVCAFQVNGPTSAYYDSFAHRGPPCNFRNVEGEQACQAQSCGGGLVYYNLHNLRSAGCDYVYVNEKTCEHIPLNSCMIQHGHGRIFISKVLAVAMNVPAKGGRANWQCTAA